MFKDKEHKDCTELILIIVAVFLVLGGCTVMGLSRLATDPDRKIAYIGAGAGITGLGIGFFGAWMGRKSDNKMKAIANLEFDEKAVMMEHYMDEFSEPGLFRTASEVEPAYRKFLWDLRAMTHVAKWADDKKRIEARKRLDEIIEHLTEVAQKGDASPAWLDLGEVNRLRDQIWSE